MIELVRQLYAIKGRSITGPGLRATLEAIGREVGDLGEWRMHAIPSGTALFDWTVPDEWALRRARCVADDGKVLADTEIHDCHVLNYSAPLRASGTVTELAEAGHVRWQSALPRYLPYLTSYYRRDSAVTITGQRAESHCDCHVDIEIDTSLEAGHLNYGELTLRGMSNHVVLLSAHCCHPQLANDNLASIAVLVNLAQSLARWQERYFTYRFVFAPGTIGALAWLAQNEGVTQDIAAGLVVACGGDPGPLTYKFSRRATSASDYAMLQALSDQADVALPRHFTPFDYDERQYNSPAFNLPVGRLTRTPNGEYPQYHTSADNLALVTPHALRDTAGVLSAWVEVLETVRPMPPLPTFGGSSGPLRIDGRGEPQLGKHGLYAQPELMPAILWCLNLADGYHTPAAMSERSRLPMAQIDAALGLLREKAMFV